METSIGSKGGGAQKNTIQNIPEVFVKYVYSAFEQKHYQDLCRDKFRSVQLDSSLAPIIFTWYVFVFTAALQILIVYLLLPALSSIMASMFSVPEITLLSDRRRHSRRLLSRSLNKILSQQTGMRIIREFCQQGFPHYYHQPWTSCR